MEENCEGLMDRVEGERVEGERVRCCKFVKESRDSGKDWRLLWDRSNSSVSNETCLLPTVIIICGYYVI
jgi:hypothetical protein